MTKSEEAKFERFVNLLADLIMKYGDRVLEEIEKEENKDKQANFKDKPFEGLSLSIRQCRNQRPNRTDTYNHNCVYG